MESPTPGFKSAVLDSVQHRTYNVVTSALFDLISELPPPSTPTNSLIKSLKKISWRHSWWPKNGSVFELLTFAFRTKTQAAWWSCWSAGILFFLTELRQFLLQQPLWIISQSESLCYLITFRKQKEHLKNAALRAVPIDPGFPWRASVSTTSFSDACTHTHTATYWNSEWGPGRGSNVHIWAKEENRPGVCSLYTIGANVREHTHTQILTQPSVVWRQTNATIL